MKPSHGVAYPKLRIVLPLIAGMAMLAASIAPAGASSGSGGISTGDDSGTEEAPAQAAKYERLWDNVSRRDRRWARSTAECESVATQAIGGGAGTAAPSSSSSTWRNSPKSPGGDPIEFRYRTQAVVAVELKRRDGPHHWPVCG